MSSTPIAGAPAPAILSPSDTGASAWVYRYTDAANGWRLSVATCAPPGSGKLSLGGFRIAPEERTSSPGFDSDREAVGLALGMEEKVYWSRVMKVGGPLARRDSSRIVGGKCVLHPTADARVGRPRDRALLDFAAACLKDAEERGGFFITTGQDLGHGRMHDGSMGSLEYLHERFGGSVIADTSKPTGEGNYQVLQGMLRGVGIDVRAATVGLIGCGNIGMHIIGRLREQGTTMLAVESNEARRAEVAALGVTTFAPAEKAAMLAQPMDALVVNASGGSLDDASVGVACANARLKVVCGSENLVMPDEAAGAERFRQAEIAYAPTELGGMMGYLTAVEQYLAAAEGVPFDIGTLMEAAKMLEPGAYEATRLCVERSFEIGFADAVREIGAS